MGNILRLDNKMAMTKLLTLAKDLSKEHNVLFGVDKNMSIFIGTTYNDNNGFATESKVGVSEFVNNRKLFFFLHSNSVLDCDFARVVLNMYHETAHCLQKNSLFRESDLDELATNQLIQEIACRDNYNYYYDDGNYRVNASEIQAEQYGIVSAYEYLCDEFKHVDDKDLESIIVSIVNDKMKNSSYFIEGYDDFHSVKEIEDAFEKAYDDSFTKDRWYFVERKNTQDCVKKYMQEHPEAKEVYLSLHDPLEKDRCIAAINLQLHPEWIKAYPMLQKMDLSYENVILKPYQAIINRKTPEQIREEEIQKILYGDSYKGKKISTSDIQETVHQPLIDEKEQEKIHSRRVQAVKGIVENINQNKNKTNEDDYEYQ